MRVFFLLFFCFFSLFAKEIYTKALLKNDKINIYIINKSLFDVTLKLDYKIQMQNSKIDKTYIDSFKSKTITKIKSYKIDGKLKKYTSKYIWAIGNKNSIHDDNYLYRLPYKIDKKVKITQGFNGVFSHNKPSSKYAVDFNLKINDKIYASRGGIVVKVKQDSKKGGINKKFKKDANYVLIKHYDGTYGKYAHLKYKGSKVKKGDLVSRGDFIALSGNTGYSSGPHLHFIVFKGKSFKEREAIKIKFISKEGILKYPKRGASYTAVH